MKMTRTDRSQTMTPASMNKTPTIAQMTTNFQSDYALAHAQVSPYTCANCQEPVCPSDLTEYISCLPSLGPYEGRIKAPASINGYRACDSGLHPSPPPFFFTGGGGALVHLHTWVTVPSASESLQCTRERRRNIIVKRAHETPLERHGVTKTLQKSADLSVINSYCVVLVLELQKAPVTFETRVSEY